MLTPTSAIPPFPDETTALGLFIRNLERLVREEAAASRRHIADLRARPLAERVAIGRAIADVQIAQVHADGTLSLTCQRNESLFREGDMLLLSHPTATDQPQYLVTLELDEDTQLTVSTDLPGVTPLVCTTHPTGWLLDEGYLDCSDQMLAALDEAAATAVGRKRILPLLMGQSGTQQTGDEERYAHAYAQAEQWGLNSQQATAIAEAYASELTYLIQGPPGTGKTLVLARLAQLFAQDGERVLISAFTHRAINNALNKLHSLALRHDATPVTSIKIGHPARIGDLLVENYLTFDASPLPDLTGAYIVGATPFATRGSRLRGVEFDTVIFDEASQITLPLAIMGMLAARRYIFIGDQQQLPPVLATRYGDHMVRDSVFATLVERGFDTMLEETYRLNAELAAWPSATFYDGLLVPVSEAATRRISYQQAPSRFAAILDPDEPKVFVELDHRNATTRSDREASLAVDLILELLNCGIPATEIGVVVPYRAQARAIRSLLRQALPDQRQQRHAIVIDTVERMQGQEREVIILSLTTSNASFASQLADFLFQPQRLNVAITRPRSKLIILGSRYLLDACPANAEQQADLELLKELLGACWVARSH
ncbi:MAG: hypothetical protein EI684_17805 [Candidatus Viridilinea halotolerans]|uniref:DNA2/NAM7 helicase-like C-terminal domain-containing protein n=1 Tax=Candidatus Viridilinea halotolerans TaxID=2491704 RepID=A0A426TTR5_9CHLR|nr:MAG: hypothetical protein EI684_17805 [Candidatus Viridilinea halotolerans]